MSGEPWLILPTYNEAENVEAIVAAAGEVLARAPPRGLSHPHRRRRLARRHGRARRRARRRARLGRRCCTAREKNGIGPAYLAGFRHALERGRGLRDGDGLRLLPRSRRPRAPARGGPRRRRPRARLALRARRRRAATGACCAASSARAARPTRAIVLGLQVRDLTGGFKCFRREVLEAIHFDSVRSQRLRLPGRAHLPRGAGRLPRRRGADRLPRPPARHRARCRGGSPPRRCGSCRCLRFSIAPRRAPMQSRMDASAYAFAHGVRHTRATLRTWQRAPGAVLGRWMRRLGAGRGRPARGRAG